MKTKTSWRELDVYGDDGERLGTLAAVLLIDANLESATIADGRIDTWPHRFIAAPGEAPDWDTPRGAVDWRGFTEAAINSG